MAVDIEDLAVLIRDPHVDYDSRWWEPSPVEQACAVRIPEVVVSHPLSEAIVQGMRWAAPLPEESRLAPVAVSYAVYLRRSVAPSPGAGRQVEDAFLDLLRKITGHPGEGAAVVVGTGGP
ncbi:hypothetical protein IQ279_10995 [Streptomyces verrucosisporus]|uniref:hypothetical protein n=1 Tax=Streptomyces verrucosisporus TaxID=1695161 RepID=UPI0019CFA66C|nr:hypothetical protein [Streptomyces verrucosisporus]MBN3930153.1 hypothetical protein [Streptomyces verrucosisporus]